VMLRLPKCPVCKKASRFSLATWIKFRGGHLVRTVLATVPLTKLQFCETCEVAFDPETGRWDMLELGAQ